MEGLWKNERGKKDKERLLLIINYFRCKGVRKFLGKVCRRREKVYMR